MVSQHCIRWLPGSITLQWRHNGRDSISNHQPHDCSLSRLFRHRSKKISKLHVTGLCAGNSSGTGEFPAQMASSAENVSIWWCHQMFPFDDVIMRQQAITPRKDQQCHMESQGHNQLTHQGRGKMAAHFPEDIFKCIFLNRNVWISIKISLKFVSEGPINNIPVLVQTMA